MYEPHLALHEARRLTLLAEAARAHLTAVAACCRPSALRSGVRTLAAHARDLLPARRASDVCCV